MRIAGGMFGFEGSLGYVQTNVPQFMSEPRLLFLSARCAIQFLIHKLNPPQVWMPSYLCCSMIDAVDQKLTKLMFFQIGLDLESVSLDWLDLLSPGSLVVLIDYFGFPCSRQVIKDVQSRGAFVLEDASQALLSSHVGHQSDFVLFSPRKTIGVPDGGVLQFRRNHPSFSVELLPPPRKWWLKALEACIARREFDKFGGDSSWYELFRQVEGTYPLGLYRMSELSEFLIETAFNYDAIAEARRANYAYLMERLSDYALIKELDDSTVPIGFPISVNNRDNVRQALFDLQIYPPIHWEINECVPNSFNASHELSKRIMTIPCDQRLKRDNLIRIADILSAAMGRK
jgi:hypothetical protein